MSRTTVAGRPALPAVTAVGRFLYWLVRNLIVVVSRLYFRVSVRGREHVPSTGPFVLAPVHRSNLDFGLVSVLTKRHLRYMGKESLWAWPWFGRIISSMGAFRVVRGSADREALRRTIEVLEEGDGLVLFPEGTRQSGPVVEELFEGAAYVACRTGAAIVPVGIGGSERAMGRGVKVPRPVKVRLVVGPPLHPDPLPAGRRHPSRRSVRELSNRLRVELQRLFDEAEGRVRSGDVNESGPSGVSKA